MVGDVVEDVAGPAAIDQPASLPARALEGRRAAGSRPGEDHVPDVQAGRGAVVDLRERAVGKVAVVPVLREGNSSFGTKLMLIVSHHVFYGSDAYALSYCMMIYCNSKSPMAFSRRFTASFPFSLYILVLLETRTS